MISKSSLLLYFILLLISSLVAKKTPEEIQLEIDKKNKEAKELKSEISYITEQIENKDIEGKSTIKKLSDIEKKIQLAGELLEILKKDEKNINNSILSSEIKISEKEKELGQIKDKAIKMLTHLYKNKRNNYLDILVGSDNWTDLIYKVKYLEILSGEHEKIKNDMDFVIKELDNDILALTADLIDKKNTQKNKKNTLVELLVSQENNKNILDNIQSETFDLEKMNTKKKSMLIQIDELIKSLYIDKESSEERERELERIRKEKENKDLESLSDLENFEKQKGELPWPANGSIISKFGEFENNGIKTTNLGIEIKTKKNADVLSVYDGIVIEIGFNPYYGSFIWIDHGKGFSTIYANLNDENIFVSKKEYIEKNKVIGKIQNVENNSHGILNFMIWGNDGKDTNGNYILINENPEEWIE